LTRKEKRYTFGFFFSAVPLFLAGCASGFFVFPHIVEVLAGFAPAEDTSIFLAKYYVDFALKLVFAVGIAFVLPVFVVLLNFMGVISAEGILKGWRVAILTITIFCALATPAADVFSMFLLAIPMVMLYFAAVGVAFWHDRIAAKRAAKLLTEGLGSSPA
ncbi:MAG: twin-arginine translocase subunit TatC, partial [Microbacteriaceae bacterium]|nr:twin-arginine translocase subunit TatC [Microbacteriaceae bacterium]